MKRAACIRSKWATCPVASECAKISFKIAQKCFFHCQNKIWCQNKILLVRKMDTKSFDDLAFKIESDSDNDDVSTTDSGMYYEQKLEKYFFVNF